MGSRLGQLTSGELDKTIAAADWLVNKVGKMGILEPVISAKVSSLLADCKAETEDREAAALRSRREAAGRPDPLDHYSA